MYCDADANCKRRSESDYPGWVAETEAHTFSGYATYSVYHAECCPMWQGGDECWRPINSYHPIELTEDFFRVRVGQELEKVWWLREHLSDDSKEAKAFDILREYSQFRQVAEELVKEAATEEEVPGNE